MAEGGGSGYTAMLPGSSRESAEGQMAPVAGGKRKEAPSSPATADAPHDRVDAHMQRVSVVSQRLQSLLQPAAPAAATAATSTSTTPAASASSAPTALSPSSLAGVFFALDSLRSEPASVYRSAENRELLAAYSTGIALHRGSQVRCPSRCYR